MNVETNDEWDTPVTPGLTPGTNLGPDPREKKNKKKKSIFFSAASTSSYGGGGASDSGLSDDGTGSGTGRIGAGGASKQPRVKFSKAKKLHKSMSQHYMKQLKAAKASKFAVSIFKAKSFFQDPI